MKRLQYKFKLYKRFSLDVFGLFFMNRFRVRRIGKFIYSAFLIRTNLRLLSKMQRFSSFKDLDVKRFRIRLSRKYVYVYFLKLFYYGLRQAQIDFLVCRASRMHGFWLDNFLFLLESRVSTLLYRSFFFFNLVGLKQFIGRGSVLLNRFVINNFNLRVCFGDIIQILPGFWEVLRYNIFLRLRGGTVLHIFPSYIFVSFIFMFCLLISYPKYFQVVFPIGLDVYRLVDLI